MKNSSFRFHPLRKRLIKIPQDILDILDAYTQADKIRADARGNLFISIELAVRSRGRMNCKALDVADIGEMAEQLQAFDELPARLHSAFDAKSKD